MWKATQFQKNENELLGISDSFLKTETRLQECLSAVLLLEQSKVASSQYVKKGTNVDETFKTFVSFSRDLKHETRFKSSFTWRAQFNYFYKGEH